MEVLRGMGDERDSLSRSNQITGLLMPKLNRISKHVYIEQLPDVLFLVVVCTVQASQSDVHISADSAEATVTMHLLTKSRPETKDNETAVVCRVLTYLRSYQRWRTFCEFCPTPCLSCSFQRLSRCRL